MALKTNNISETDKYSHLVFILILTAHFAITFYCLYLRYATFAMREAVDSATFMQATWSILHADPYTVSIHDYVTSYFPHNFFGDQLMLILVFIAPLLLISSSGVTFLVIQSLTITSGAVFLYYLSRDTLKTSYLPLLITVFYLSSPIIFLTYSQFGFRVETLFIPFAFAIFYFMGKQKTVYASLFVVLLLITKHNAIPVVFLIGIYFLMAQRHQWRFSLFCILLSVVYYYVGIEIVMVSFQEDAINHFKHFAKFGDSPIVALFNMIQNPALVAEYLSDNEVEHVNMLLYPAGYMGLIHPVSWIPSVQAVMNIVVNDYNSTIANWHWALVAPFIFMGVLFSIRWLQAITNESKYVLTGIYILIVFQIVLNIFSFSEKVILAEDNFYYRDIKVNASAVREQLKIIEPNASVMVSDTLLWDMYARDRVHVARTRFYDDVDYIAVLKPLGASNTLNRFFLREMEKHSLQGKSKFDKYRVVSNSENLVIMKKRAP